MVPSVFGDVTATFLGRDKGLVWDSTYLPMASKHAQLSSNVHARVDLSAWPIPLPIHWFLSCRIQHSLSREREKDRCDHEDL